MKKVAMLLVLLSGVFIGGCCCSNWPVCDVYRAPCCDGSTLVETACERQARIAMQTNLNCREALEDWDYFWLNERTSRLTQWHPYVGF